MRIVKNKDTGEVTIHPETIRERLTVAREKHLTYKNENEKKIEKIDKALAFLDSNPGAEELYETLSAMNTECYR